METVYYVYLYESWWKGEEYYHTSIPVGIFKTREHAEDAGHVAFSLYIEKHGRPDRNVRCFVVPFEVGFFTDEIRKATK